MAFKPGYLGHFSLDNAAGTLTNLSSYIDNVTVPIPTETLEVTAFGSASRHYIPGLSDGGQISVSGPYDVTVSSHVNGIRAAQAAGTASHSFQWGPGGSVASQARVTGEVIVTDFQLSSGVGGRAEYSLSLQVTGATTLGTF